MLSLLETENVAVLSREPLNHLGLILGHVQDLLALRVAVSRRAWNESRAHTGVLLPYLLSLRSRKKNSKEMGHTGMPGAFKHAAIVGRRNHRLYTLCVREGRSRYLCSVNEVIGQRDRDEDFTQLKTGIGVSQPAQGRLLLG